LARMLFDGRGSSRDEAEAEQLRGLVASGGASRDILELANMYAEGRGAPKNEEEAVGLYRSALDLGAKSAAIPLAQAMQEGRGTAKNTAGAAELLWTAMTTGPVAERRNVATFVMRRAADWSTEVRRDLKQRLWQAGLYTGSSDPTFGEDVKPAFDALVVR